MDVTKPSVLFVCVHNAGRSQMAAGYLREFSADRVEVRSAGSGSADRLNLVAVAAVVEDGSTSPPRRRQCSPASPSRSPTW